MRKLKFWPCFALYDIGAKNFKLCTKNIKCIGTATKRLSEYLWCVHFSWSIHMPSTDITLVASFFSVWKSHTGLNENNLFALSERNSVT